MCVERKESIKLGEDIESGPPPAPPLGLLIVIFLFLTASKPIKAPIMVIHVNTLKNAPLNWNLEKARFHIQRLDIV